MKKNICFIIAILMILFNLSLVQAKEGACGYEGGISSGQNLSTSQSSSEYEYQEVVFITGKPIVMKGKVNIKKKLSDNTQITTYKYDISDTKDNSLRRTVSFETKINEKDNGQIVKETSIYKEPSETIKINDKSYTLDTYYLTKSSLTDKKPAADYFAGNIKSRKVYENKDSEGNTITVTTKGEVYGFDQSWSTGEVQILDYYIKNESANDVWTGTAKVKLSSTLTTELKYAKNFLQQISFEGGYVKSQNVVSKLRYETNMPQFDKNGISTDRIIKKQGNLKLETFPKEQRLVSRDLSSIRGHWAEEYVNKLYSLEIYDDHPSVFVPDQYMARGEFAKALGKTIDISLTDSEDTEDESKEPISPFEDVKTTNPLYPYIQYLVSNDVLNLEQGKFLPYEPITRVEAISAFVKILGLEKISKDKYPVTHFKDNDKIPKWALRPICAAYRIGLVEGNDGYLMPNKYLTKAEAATLINRFIDYMRKTMPKNYSDRVLNY